MPKKTRKEKIISQLRRQLRDASISQPQPKTQVTLPKTTEYTPNLNFKQTNNVAKTDYSYVKSDLIRISLISLGALIFEIALYIILNLK